MTLRSAIYFVHRWLGIGMCLLIAMWFASGMVMVYIAYPELTETERYAGLAALDPDRIVFSPTALLAKEPVGAAIESLILTSAAKRPLYLLKRVGQPWQGMYGDSGEWLVDLTVDSAVASAVSFYQSQHPERSAHGAHRQTLDMDQWTVSSELSDHRPLYLVSIEDELATHLYVSSRTGQVVRDTTRRERLWNWLGANLHWIYPMQLRKHRELWVNTVIVLSLSGLIAVVTGAIIGLTRLRIRHRPEGESCSPYRGILKYHHVAGLLSLVFLTTFLFSGLMSVRPWGLFDDSSSFSQQRKGYQLADALFSAQLAYAQVDEIRQLLKQEAPPGAKEVYWHWLGGESYVTLHRSEQQRRHRFARNEDQTLAHKIHQNAYRLIPDAAILTEERLGEYDTYYYSHHDRWRPLPILRVRFSDRESTWFHIDLATGEVLDRLTFKRRVERWLFSGLHSLDFAVLINNRPLWHLVIVFLCIFGLVFSVTSVVLGWRRLYNRQREKGTLKHRR